MDDVATVRQILYPNQTKVYVDDLKQEYHTEIMEFPIVSNKFLKTAILALTKLLHELCNNRALNAVSGLNRLLCRRYNARTLTPHLRA